ncbi:MAG: indolepyruvate oxidoreductase subunit beta family protein [Burkholderiaceae bacterium]
MTAPVTILLCALGGEGGGVLADWLVAVARACGHAVQGTSIPGVAQRTGATTYYVEIFPRPDAELGDAKPVFGLYAVPGGVDVVVGSELLEVVRQAAAGMVSPDRTAVIASTRRTLTTAEKMQLADGRASSEQLVRVLRDQARELELFDMAQMAADSGTVISAVMFGALGAWFHASGRLPFARAAYEAVIRAGGKGAEASLRGFGAAWQRVADAAAQRERVLAAADLAARAVAPKIPSLPPDVATTFPPAAHEIIALGLARVVEYQDGAYGQLYLQRLRSLLQTEREAGAADAAATIEAARWLALWMAFDDIVRVADLKSRASRFARVRREVNAADDELLRVFDHFKPGVPEIAALLPAPLAARLQRWDRARVARGAEPFALPVKLPAHRLHGLLALRLLASMKGWRRRGARFAQEQALIERWLAGIARGLREHAALGLEIARCGRLVKGYGATNERGRDNLLHVLDHLALDAALGDALARAAAVKAAREAALADDAGTALDAALLRHGAPARPLREQPVRILRRPGAASAIR